MKDLDTLIVFVLRALLVGLSFGCGAKTDLEWSTDPSQIYGRLPDGSTSTVRAPFATCIDAQIGRVGEWLPLRGALSDGTSGTVVGWGAPFDPPINEIESWQQSSTRFRAAVPGRFELTFSTRSPDGTRRFCNTTVLVQRDILFACNSDSTGDWAVNGLLGELLEIDPHASSATGRPLTFRWTLQARQPGSSSELESVDQPVTRLRLDRVGRWIVQLDIANDRGERATCRYSVGSFPDVATRCPDRVRARVGEYAELAPLEVRNRMAQPLRTAWEVTNPWPVGTNSLMPEQLGNGRARLFVDMVEQWVVLFGAVPPAGEGVSCRSRVEGYSDDDLRVELLWNQALPSPGPQRVDGFGQRLSLHAALRSADESGFPGTSGCSGGRCVCRDEVETNCATSAADWPPSGPVNDGYLRAPRDCSHSGPYMLSVRRAQAGSVFELGATFDEFCNPGTEPIEARAAGAFVRVYCGGALVYMSEYVQLRDPRTLREPDAWRIGTVTINADRSCTVQRRCSPGVEQDRCVGPRSLVFGS
jgi:hypothetical protein